MHRKPFRIPPQAGQISCHDFPRPPLLETTGKRLVVKHHGTILADTTHGFRVLETYHPPVYYFPPESVNWNVIKPQITQTSTYCEFKGQALYYDLHMGSNVFVESIGWSYPNPSSKSYQPIKGYLAFYASKVDECTVNGEKATPQEGSFYGGWITSDISGEFKGGPGTLFW